ncbi:MAG TPA: hypothetical protein VF219_22935 [Vicinamibacterales bacterium]
MKTDEHSERRLRDRRIKREWCERILANPIEVRQQENGMYQMWGFVVEMGKYLRIVMLEDKETLHTAHPDRRYKGPR